MAELESFDAVIVGAGISGSLIAKQLGLPTRNLRTVAYADGRTESVPLAGPLVFDIDGRDTFDDAYIVGDEVLIQCKIVASPESCESPARSFGRTAIDFEAPFDQKPVCEVVADGAAFLKVFDHA